MPDRVVKTRGHVVQKVNTTRGNNIVRMHPQSEHIILVDSGRCALVS